MRVPRGFDHVQRGPLDGDIRDVSRAKAAWLRLNGRPIY